MRTHYFIVTWFTYILVQGCKAIVLYRQTLWGFRGFSKLPKVEVVLSKIYFTHR